RVPCERLLLRSTKKIGGDPMSTKANEGKDLDLGEIYTKSELFLEKHKQPVTIAVVALLVIVGGLLGYQRFIAEPRAEEARELIWKAQYYFEIDSLDQALNGDGNYQIGRASCRDSG